MSAEETKAKLNAAVNMVIGYVNEAIDAMNEGPDELRDIVEGESLDILLQQARAALARRTGASEDTRLVDAEEIMEPPSAQDEILDEFWVFVNEDDEEEVDDVNYDEFVRIVGRMPDDEANWYRNRLSDAENAEQRGILFEIIIEKWGSDAKA